MPPVSLCIFTYYSHSLICLSYLLLYYNTLFYFKVATSTPVDCVFKCPRTLWVYIMYNAILAQGIEPETFGLKSDKMLCIGKTRIPFWSMPPTTNGPLNTHGNTIQSVQDFDSHIDSEIQSHVQAFEYGFFVSPSNFSQLISGKYPPTGDYMI